MEQSRAMASNDLEALAGRAHARKPLTDAELAPDVGTLGGRWTVADGALTLHLPAKGMARTTQVAAHAGALADELDHHPKIVVEYPGLTLTINTHDVGGITGTDLVFAARLEQWLRANGWPAA
jgi:4a-hydroxytetrahydrobiopterin dehydratase